MSQQEIQILSKILNLINKSRYEDEDEFAVRLGRIFLKNRDKNIFLNESQKVKTSFFRKNKIKKSEFLNYVIRELDGLKIDVVDKYPIQISLDDIDSFSKMKNIRSSVPFVNVSEKDVELYFNKLIGNPYEHKHWGGEFSDGFNTKVVFEKRRIPTTIALNGKGKINNISKGLTVADCGKNGDQIQRLFKEPANLFILQCVGKIHNSVYQGMLAEATLKSRAGGEVYYCLIDGNDTARIIKAAQGE